MRKIIISKGMAVLSFFNETFKKVNINMSMDIDSTKNVLDEETVFITPYFPSGNICLYLNQDFCSQFIHAIIKILENHLIFCVCDRT